MILLAVLGCLALQSSPTPATCATTADCSTQAEAAAAAGDYEAFHDLAWRAVQKGKPNDPRLMYLLARAQSLSGRPDDALVMLGRLADAGIGSDAATNPDFARVRLLPGWPALEARLSALDAPAPGPTAPAPPAAPSSSAPVPPPPAPASAAASAPLSAASSAASPAAGSTASAPARGRPSTPEPAAPSPSAPSPSLEFSAPAALAPFALAHDAVSRRFVVGDRRARRLLVVDEVSRNVVNYVSAASAGFYEHLTGLTIDARRGDLWVVSSQGAEDASVSILHKLQLVSGRVLSEIGLPEDAGPVRLVDVAVMPDGTVYVLDAIGSRLFRLAPAGSKLQAVKGVTLPPAAALVAADDRTLYVGGPNGVVRVDLTAPSVHPLKSAQSLKRMVSLWWRNGALLGVQRLDEGWRIVRLRVDESGMRVRQYSVLAASSDEIVGTLAPDGFYYLSDPGTIRRLSVR